MQASEAVDAGKTGFSTDGDGAIRLDEVQLVQNGPRLFDTYADSTTDGPEVQALGEVVTATTCTTTVAGKAASPVTMRFFYPIRG